MGNDCGENTTKLLKSLYLIRLLCYNKRVNKLNTGTGVSTEVSLPSGSSEEIRVGSNPVTCTKRDSRALAVLLFCFIKVMGFEIGRRMRERFVRRTKQSGGLFVG